MKKMTALLLMFIMVLCLVSCSGADDPKNSVSPSPEDYSVSEEPSAEPNDAEDNPTDEAVLGDGNRPTAAEYLATVRETYSETTPKLMELSDEELNDFYGLDPSLLDDYVCAIPMMNVHATEVFIGKPTEGKEQDVKDALEARLDALRATWSTYLPEQYDLVENYKLVEEGGYILFVVHQNAEEIADDFVASYAVE